MKKILRTTIIILLVLIVSFAGYKIVKTQLLEKAETTTTESTTVSTTTTVATTTTTTTKPTTTKTTTTTTEATTTVPETTTTESTPAIDLKNLSIIDLYPLSLSGGDRDIKHCQGITVDQENGYIYYSYTTMLIKCDFEGNIVASVEGIDGHMGDITYNEADKKIYCGHYATGRTGFYIYIFDTTKIKKMKMKPTKDVVRSVYVKEAYEDYLYTWETEDEDGNITKHQHKYGCSGIDGITMGPDFSKKNKKKEFLTVAYGIYSDTTRKDNNYQVLLQYDITDWWDKYGQKVSVTPHRVGPEKCSKYFLYTGNTQYGTQTMEYFDELNIWILNCYDGDKEAFNKYTLFAIDGDFRAKKTKLKGQPEKDMQYTLTLYTDGSYDSKHNIWGWYSKYGTQGVAYMGNGLFYVCQPYKTWTGTKLAICYLNVWKSDKKGNGPFTLAVDVAFDYKIKKAKHVVVTTTASQKDNSTTKKNTLGDIIQNLFG